ncbi:MAG TPA: GNAT family N-acetyltransferase [Myxococcales bacterium]
MRVRSRLDSPLPLGQLVAIPAGEDSLARVGSCVEGASDYFRRNHAQRHAERLAAELLSDALADPARRLFVLEDAEGAPAGLLDLALDAPGPREATVALLVLDRRHRGLGLGREVVESLFAELADQGFERVRLGVAPGEADAARFWRAVGMWPCGVEEGVRLFERPLRS